MKAHLKFVPHSKFEMMKEDGFIFRNVIDVDGHEGEGGERGIL